MDSESTVTDELCKVFDSPIKFANIKPWGVGHTVKQRKRYLANIFARIADTDTREDLFIMLLEASDDQVMKGYTWK